MSAKPVINEAKPRVFLTNAGTMRQCSYLRDTKFVGIRKSQITPKGVFQPARQSEKLDLLKLTSRIQHC